MEEILLLLVLQINMAILSATWSLKHRMPTKKTWSNILKKKWYRFLTLK